MTQNNIHVEQRLWLTKKKKIGNHKFEIKYVIIQHNILTITLSPMFCPNTNDPLDGLMEDLKKKKSEKFKPLLLQSTD